MTRAMVLIATHRKNTLIKPSFTVNIPDRASPTGVAIQYKDATKPNLEMEKEDVEGEFFFNLFSSYIDIVL